MPTTPQKKKKSKNLARARHLRKNLTPAERRLWLILRYDQCDGFRFRRQVPLGPYIVDFVCYEARLIIEVDGGQHNEAREMKYDAKRTQWLEQQGYRVHRFWNNEIMNELHVVKEMMIEFLSTPMGGA